MDLAAAHGTPTTRAGATVSAFAGATEPRHHGSRCRQRRPQHRPGPCGRRQCGHVRLHAQRRRRGGARRPAGTARQFRTMSWYVQESADGFSHCVCLDVEGSETGNIAAVSITTAEEAAADLLRLPGGGECWPGGVLPGPPVGTHGGIPRPCPGLLRHVRACLRGGDVPQGPAPGRVVPVRDVAHHERLERAPVLPARALHRQSGVPGQARQPMVCRRGAVPRRAAGGRRRRGAPPRRRHPDEGEAPAPVQPHWHPPVQPDHHGGHRAGPPPHSKVPGTQGTGPPGQHGIQGEARTRTHMAGTGAAAIVGPGALAGVPGGGSGPGPTWWWSRPCRMPT